MLQSEVLIRERLAVNGLSHNTVVAGEVTTLAHESRNDTVERRGLEAKSFFACAKSTEVLGSRRDYIGTKIDNNPAKGWCSHQR